MLPKITHFLIDTLWRIPVRTLSQPRAFFIKILRILTATVQHFFSNRSQLTAAALTYYTLLSIVPVLAAMLAVAKGFGLQTMVEKELLDNFAQQEVALTQALDFANKLLEQVKPGLLATISIGFLVWAIIKVLSHVERAFNRIWHVERARRWGRRFTDYLAVVLVTPILFIVASTVTVFISSSEHPLAQVFAVQALPYTITWLLFALFYIFMPNTRVGIFPAISGGIVAGTLYQLLQWGYVKFQIGVASYGAIYGSFAALPLFLIWLQFSWVIVLLGSEIAYVSQHVSAWEFKKDVNRISASYHRLLCLFVCQKALTLYHNDQLPTSTEELAEELGIPIILVEKIIADLCRAECMIETATEKDLSPAYTLTPQMPSMTIKETIDALEHVGIEDLPINITDGYRRLQKNLATFDTLVSDSPTNRLLKDI